MTYQTQIDFFHTKENNSHSQQILDDNYDRLNNQCRTVLNVLMTGRRLTVKDAMNEYGIGDLRRRVKDINDNHYIPIRIKSDVLPGGFKEYYL